MVTKSFFGSQKYDISWNLLPSQISIKSISCLGDRGNIKPITFIFPVTKKLTTFFRRNEPGQNSIQAHNSQCNSCGIYHILGNLKYCYTIIVNGLMQNRFCNA